MYEVIDASGRVRRLADDAVCPPGCTLRTPLRFLDHQQRAVKQAAANPYAISDEQVQKVADAYAAFKERVGAGMRRHHVPIDVPDDLADGEDPDPRAVAYGAMKKRLGKKRKRKPIKPETFVE